MNGDFHAEKENLLAKTGSEYNIDDGDWNLYRRMTVLTFSSDTHGNVSSKYHGMIVYRDRGSEDTILPGETWIVSLTLNPATERNYFARAIKRLDASFMFELSKDQIDEIADCLWKTQRDKVEPVLLEKYADLHKEQVEKEVLERTSKMTAELESANERADAMEHKSMEDERIIDSLNKKLALREAAAPQAGAAVRQAAPVAGIADEDVTVMRIGPDTLISDFFTGNRYSVHIAADMRVMIIVPDPDGNILCVDNTMTLAGLNAIVPYGGDETEMMSKYSPEYGGLTVFLA